MLYNMFSTKYAIFAKKIIMNPTNKLIAFIFAAMILFGIGAFIGVKLQKEPYSIPEYSYNDSIANVKMDSVKGIYQQVIDSINKRKPTIIYRVKTIRESDTTQYIGKDTACIEIIERKNNLINALDSLNYELDLEARTYSELLDIEKKQRTLDTLRFTALKHESDSVIQNYKDTLKIERKQHKKKVFFYKVTTTIAAVLGIYGTVR